MNSSSRSSLSGNGRGQPFRCLRLALVLLVLQCLAEPAPAQAPPIAGTIFAYAGGGNGDGGPAGNAIIDPQGVEARVRAGGLVDLYVADGLNNRVRRVDGATGTIETLAGVGAAGYGGDNGPATEAKLSFPADVAVDDAGTVFIADRYNNRIRRVDPQGVITTFAGDGRFVFAGDGGLAKSASLADPQAVAIDQSGNVYIADSANNRIRKVGLDGRITTVAGNGQFGTGGDGGAATAAQLAGPTDVAVDAAGNLYIAVVDHRVRKVATDGQITTVAGTGFAGFAGDGGLATQARLNLPTRVALDGGEALFIADRGNLRVRMVNVRTGIIFTRAGTGQAGPGGDGGLPSNADLDEPVGLAATASGDVYVSVTRALEARTTRKRVRWIEGTQVIRTVVGGGVGDGADAINALIYPGGAAYVRAPSGASYLYAADSKNNRVRRVDERTGMIETIAGTGDAGYAGDGGPALAARLNTPQDVAVAADGAIFVADTTNNRIRRISPSGVIQSVAGTGVWKYGGDGGPAVNAGLAAPAGLDVDGNGNLFIADTDNNRVRRVSLSTGIIVTVAGNGQWGAGGDGGPATAARLASPKDVVAANDGSLYIADAFNNSVRHVSAAGVITTVAGTGWAGFGGDGGPATGALLNKPFQVALDGLANLFIADSRNHRVRRVDAASGLIHSVAGTGLPGSEGDGGPAVLAKLSSPSALTIDEAGTQLFVSMPDDGRVRLVLFGMPFPPSPTATPAATATPTVPAPTSTPTRTPTRTPTSTPTRTPTRTPTSTPTFSPTRTFTATPTPTSTHTPTRTPTATPTHSATRTPTPTATPTPRPCLIDVDGDGTASVATDIAYITRHLLGLPPVPPSFRDLDPTIPDDRTIAARIDAIGTALDVDSNGAVSVATDLVYIGRYRLGLPPVPPSFRDLDPGIPPDSEVAANAAALCP